MFSGLQNGSGPISHGAYTVLAADATAGSVALNTGLSIIETFMVHVLRAGVGVTADAVLSTSGGTLTVTNGAVTYVLTAGDVLQWIAIGM